MEYREIISRAMKSFFENDRSFPSSLLYPILGYDNNGSIVDKFLVCKMTRNEGNGSIEKIEPPTEIYQQKIDTLDIGEFVEPISATDADSKWELNYDRETSIGDFTELYMKVREFVFTDIKGEEQRSVLKKLVTIYDVLFDRKIRKLYHKYSHHFFKWAYKELKEQD